MKEGLTTIGNYGASDINVKELEHQKAIATRVKLKWKLNSILLSIIFMEP
jgi:hypothetical protein